MSTRPQRLLHDALLAATERAPGKTAIVVEGRPYRYEALLDAALRLARAFQDRGLRRGDRVVIHLDNSWPCVVSVYATLLAGGAVVVVNPQTRADKLAYVVVDSEAAIVVGDGTVLGSATPALGAALRDRCIVGVGAAPEGIVDFDALVQGTEPSPRECGVIPLDLAALIYTSGSTGAPKGVMMAHQNMVFAAGSIAQYLRLGAEDRILNVLPLAFDYGLYQLLMSVSLGATLVLERSFTFPMQTVQRVREERVTVFPGVPTIFATLLSLGRQSEIAMPTVARVTNTAASLPAGFIPRLQGPFPNALIFSMYGLTECKRVCYLEPEQLGRKPTSVGKAIPGTEVFLLSPDGEPVAAGEPGILHVRGPHVMLGYWRQPDQSARMLKPGRYPGERVLCTHDHFRMDEEGFLYFLGRSDDIIKTRGEKVSPREVEEVLHGIPGVREAAVVGVPDETLGEAIRAYVVLEEGSALAPQEIRRHCRARLEGFMVPQEIVILDELPRTDTAKVRKQSLRELASRKEPAPA